MPQSKKITINTYDLEAKKLDSLSLDPALFDRKDNPDLVAQAIRVYLSNQRRAYPKVKNRAEVRGTTKKVWKQKGTGRARHGDRRAPIFVGGGKAHGPRGNQKFKLKLNKKMRSQARLIVLSHLAREKRIIAIKGLSSLSPKTKVAQALLQKLEKKEKLLKNSKRIAIIITPKEKTVKIAFKNIPHASLFSTQSLNSYRLSREKFLIFSQLALTKFQEINENKN